MISLITRLGDGTIALSNCTSCGAISSGCNVPACPAVRTWEWRLRNLFLITSNCPSLSAASSHYTSSSLHVLRYPPVHPQCLKQVTESCLLPVAGSSILSESTPGLPALSSVSTALSSLFTAPLLSMWCYPPSLFLSPLLLWVLHSPANNVSWSFEDTCFLFGCGMFLLTRSPALETVCISKYRKTLWTRSCQRRDRQNRREI